MRAINRVFADAGQTYFPKPGTPLHALCAMGLCNTPLAHQRSLRAAILTTFTTQTIVDMDGFLHNSCWSTLLAEIGTFEQAIENVKVATDTCWSDTRYYNKRTCVEKFGREECTAYHLNSSNTSAIANFEHTVHYATAHVNKLHHFARTYYNDIMQAIRDMKDKQAQIEQALMNASGSTILNSAEELEAFVWWYGAKTRAGVDTVVFADI